MERYAPNAKDLASRDVVSRAMTVEMREGRGVGPEHDHIALHLEHLGEGVIHERLPGIAETARIFAGVVPGLMAVGEAACVSVHGANRLGSNSLLDLVIFGREAARRCAETVKPGSPHRPWAADAGQTAVARLDRLRNANGARSSAAIRLEMQKAMQLDAAVFRSGESLAQGIERIGATFARLTPLRNTAASSCMAFCISRR